MTKSISIIGAGPAGLTSALLLARAGYQVKVFEKNPTQVGGLSRTIYKNGYRFDIGGHRFFTKDAEVEKFWNDIIGEDFLTRKRISSIYYNEQFISYPLKPFELLYKLSFIQNCAFVISYLLEKLFPSPKENHYENWVIRNFGKSLFNTFFKTYTEKVWGIKCHEISSDWAAQRINNLNAKTIITSAIKKKFQHKGTKEEVKSLIGEFKYPKLGPGMLWDKVAEEIVQLGGTIKLNASVEHLFFNDKNQMWQLKIQNDDNLHQSELLISTMPLKELLYSIGDLCPLSLKNKISQFKFRSFITVAIMFRGENTFKDNWIYIHDTRVKVGRIQNYQNWSPYLTKSNQHVCYGLEYFCQMKDDFWNLDDKVLLQNALSELQILGIEYNNDELDFTVIRSANAYPIYDLHYYERTLEVKKFLNELPSLFPIGRGGLHKYNNQDHSIKTAMLTVKNIVSNKKLYDPWLVNQDAEYIEKIYS